jgi:hypothetical protein
MEDGEDDPNEQVRARPGDSLLDQHLGEQCVDNFRQLSRIYSLSTKHTAGRPYIHNGALLRNCEAIGSVEISNEHKPGNRSD